MFRGFVDRIRRVRGVCVQSSRVRARLRSLRIGVTLVSTSHASAMIKHSLKLRYLLHARSVVRAFITVYIARTRENKYGRASHFFPSRFFSCRAGGTLRYLSAIRVFSFSLTRLASTIIMKKKKESPVKSRRIVRTALATERAYYARRVARSRRRRSERTRLRH